MEGIYRIPEDIPLIMNKQREIQTKKEFKDRIHIGGEINISVLDGEGFITTTTHRFNDYEKDIQTMLSNLHSSSSV